MSHCKNCGFTLIEVLVTIIILGILATIGFGQYRTSQAKARDAQRKADLDNIARALEMYYNDHRAYPIASGGTLGVDWGEAFEDENSIYMKTLPKDPASNQNYCYDSVDGTYFKLYAKLENERDADFGSYTCNADAEYSYGISSPNTTP